ncbi:MAG: hypothetical protein IT356_05505 [Gemmatimonadaceae bacterium]|nr:hypothetical protein [Gemmatimonadaceae bacterium]
MLNTLKRAGMAAATVAVLAGVSQASAQGRDATPTEEFVACKDNAAAAFDECIDGARWYEKIACTAKLAADIVLCVPTIILRT